MYAFINFFTRLAFATLFALVLLTNANVALGQQRDGNRIVPLLRQLDDKDKQVRDQAANQLRQISLHSVPDLINALKHNDSRVRGNAAQTLGEVGPAAKDAVPSLIDALHDTNDSVSRSALEALENMGLEAGFASRIFASLLGHKDDVLRFQATSALRDIGAEAVPYLMDSLKSPSLLARRAAAETLSKLGSTAREAVPNLIETLQDTDSEIRWLSADALGRIGPKSRAAIPFLINAMGDENEGVRGLAVEALTRIGPESVPQLIEALYSKNLSVAAIAIDALREFGSKAKPAIPNLMELLLRNDSEDIRTRAARALGSVGPEAVPFLVIALKDANAEVRGCAAYGFYEMGEGAKIAIPELAQALRDSNPEVRRRVAAAFRQIGPAGSAAVPDLIAALKDSDEDVRQASAYAFEKIGIEAKAAIPALIDALGDEDPVLSFRSADALRVIAVGEMDAEAKAKIPKLLDALHHEDASVRRSAAMVLGKMGPEGKNAIAALIETIDDEKEDVRNSAAESLASISIALSNAWESDSVPLLRQAHTALLASPYPKVREQSELVKQSINYLDLLGWSQLINRLRNNSLIAFIIIAYVLLFLTSVLLLWLRPLWLLRINDVLSSHADKLPKTIGSIDVPFRYLLVIGFFHYHSRVLDAWVSKHVSSVRRQFSEKPTVRERNTHIAIPVLLNNKTCSDLNARMLDSVFSAELSYVLISGDGGAGKTSLACLVAYQAMSEDENERPCKHVMLPVLIEPGMEVQVDNHEESLLNLIGTQLRLLIAEKDRLSLELLRHLINRRRILLIIDSLSEMDNAARPNLLGGILSLPVNACIITSRPTEQLNGLPASNIRMLRIKGNKLSTFMELFLLQKGRRDLFSDEEFFEACRRLSSIVRDRDITALIARYYAEQMIAAKEQTIDEDLPENIPELMLKYVNILNRVPLKDAPDIQVVHRAVQIIAWECVKRTFRPAAANRQDVLTALGGPDKGGSLIKHLEEGLRIIRSVGAAQAIRITIDPLSEIFGWTLPGG